MHRLQSRPLAGPKRLACSAPISGKVQGEGSMFKGHWSLAVLIAASAVALVVKAAMSA